MNTNKALDYLKKHDPTLYKWLRESDTPAGIDDAVCEAMQVFARETCNKPDSALKLAGKLVLAAKEVVNSHALSLSDRIRELQAAVEAYDNEIYSRVDKPLNQEDKQ